MENKNVVVARIFGSDCTIAGTESPQYIKKVCETVDRRMRLAAQNPALSPMRASIICSVNLCDEMYKSKEEAAALQNGIEKLKAELRSAEKQIKILSKENSYLKDEIRAVKDANTGKSTDEKKHS